jgi:hypothetical protein
VIRTVSTAILAIGLAACTVSPVVSERRESNSLYSDCRRAARDACNYRESGDDERKQCVAEATYVCVAGGPG